MRYGSVCSGIEAATVAWEPLGWDCAFVSEIDKFPAAVLTHRFPEIPNLGDFTKIGTEDYEGDIDLLVGGTPCPSFSRAGRGAGLADERGRLALEFAELAFRTNVRWLVWENVTDVLSRHGGEDFAAFLALLVGWRVTVPDGGWKHGGLVTEAPGGFSVGWRVLDARYTRVEQFPRGIPQRRRRVIAVGYRGDARRAAEVLFGRELRGGDTPPVREDASSRADTDPTRPRKVCIPIDLMNVIGREKHLKGKGWDVNESASYTITKRYAPGVCDGKTVRHFTPRECERLMGLPDDWTLVPYRGRPAEMCKDRPRYKAIGNSMPVNVMAWIGERINEVEHYGAIKDRPGDGETSPPAEGDGG